MSIPFTDATRAWARDIGRANGHEKIAVCVLDRESASLSIIATLNGAVKTTTTKSRGNAGLIEWLGTALGRSGSRPESLYLIGSRSDLDASRPHRRIRSLQC